MLAGLYDIKPNVEMEEGVLGVILGEKSAFESYKDLLLDLNDLQSTAWRFH